MQAPLVVGTDGSDGSGTATDWAADEAVRHGIPLRVVHAALWEEYEAGGPARALHRPAEQVLTERAETAEHTVRTAGRRATRRAPGLAVSTEVVAQDASGALLREGDAGRTVVVGSRGRGELADLLLGSVGLVVAARSRGPVIVVRGDRTALESRHARVLLGVGDRDDDGPAVRFAFREAAARGAELDVVVAWHHPAHRPMQHPLMTGDPVAAHRQRAAERLDRAVEAAAHDQPGVRVRRSVVEGPARKVLVDRSAAADLLVVGARRRARPVGLELGPVAHRALHHAACPVAIVPYGPGAHAAPAGTDT